ncbi:MAG TPA: AMP-binding protein [Gammaproteobacteria bacterium]|nr:AMP-binding protein [Gammaproteobacteria bacterium]
MDDYPFDTSATKRDAQGIKHYSGLPASLIEMLRNTVERLPEAEAVVEIGGERLSYHQLWERAARVAGGLKAEGIGRGDRVAIRLPNGMDWVLAYFGTLLAGAVSVPVNTRFTDQEADYVINDSGASYVFHPDHPLPEGRAMVAEGLQLSDLASIFYTSGTTGFPKGAMLSHENFLSNAENARRVVGLPEDGEGIRNLVSVPLFHVTGCNSQLLPTAQIGGTTVIMPQFEVHDFLAAVRDERINLLTSVPAIFWLAINQPEFPELDVSGVRWVTYGGAPIAPELVRRIMQSFPNAQLGNGFGLTETSSIATYLPHQYAAEHADSVGFPAPIVDLDLFEPDGDGVGELLIRGGNVVSGYWNKPDANAATFLDGWLHTGDMARIDEHGLTYIVDRKKDMINRGGENVYCVEVENALSAHPDIFEVAVVGVPDEMMGEKVGALIVPTPGKEPDAADILAFARKHLADFKVPQYIAISQEPLPRNPGGKVLKPRLREGIDWGKPVR